jgi:predicted NAD/FAD-binding protein
MMNAEKQRMYRIRKKAKKAIEDLTYLAEQLPEKQFYQIFNNANLIPFCKAIFHRPEVNKKHILMLLAEDFFQTEYGKEVELIVHIPLRNFLNESMRVRA